MSISRAPVAIVLAALLAGCAGSPQPSAGVTMGPAAGPALEVEAGDNVFSPQTLVVEAGQTTTVEITNTGRVPHDFTIAELSLTTGVLQPGDVATATFEAPAGDVEYVCTLHRGMEGKLEVSAG